jgi:hypothetical protein
MPNKYTLSDMQRIAQERGGKCNSSQYINVKTRLDWECEKHHQWSTTADIIISGCWCPQCGRGRTGLARRLTIEEMHELAREMHGKCLATAYTNSSEKLEWECEFGHHWFADPSNIKAGHWCPYCTGKMKGTLEEFQLLAKTKGGICLSKEYIGHKSKLLFRCDKGHEWMGIPEQIKGGHWCPYCAGVARMTLADMGEIAKKRGGECLSEEYVNAKSPLQWRCNKGHTWTTPYSNIKTGNWCPTCGIESTRQKLRKPIEHIKVLAEEKGGKCLSESYSNNKINLEWQCKNGHTWKTTVRSIKKGAWCPTCKKDELVNNRSLREQTKKRGITNKERLEKLKRIAIEKKGECLSDEYIKSSVKLDWKCEKGHIFHTSADLILKGRWCPHCAVTHKSNIEKMKELAAIRGGDCISSEYINASSPLEWKCAKGHTWWEKPAQIKNGAWCKICKGRTYIGEKIIGEYKFDVLVENKFWKSGRFYVFTQDYKEEFEKLKYMDAMNLGMARGAYEIYRKQRGNSKYFAFIPNSEVLDTIPRLNPAHLKDDNYWLNPDEASKLEEFRTRFPDSKKPIFSKIISINSKIPYWSVRGWLALNIKPHISTDEILHDKDIPLEELIPQKLWRFDTMALLHHCRRMTTVGRAQVVSIGLIQST